MVLTEKQQPILDGKEGDTIFNVIEDWSKDNEYSPEEIAQRKAAAEKEKSKDKTTDGKMSNTFIGIVPDTEWTYDYFKGELEKIFANKSKFKIELPSKNDYLSRVFATFSLASLEPSETSNKVYKKNTKDVKDADASKFGDPHSIDTPIPMSVRTADDEVPGVYAFHQFIAFPLLIQYFPLIAPATTTPEPFAHFSPVKFSAKHT